MEAANEVTFSVNGDIHTVKSPAPWLTLNEWIRAQPNLKGTKRTCGEGGCGACVVMLEELIGDKVRSRAVNSCLYPVCGLHGAAVSTIEGLGGSNLGKLHPIQDRMVKHNASQCGFCTPGMVMNMYSLLASKDNKVSAQQVEHAFDGNICRCTGYRPILDAMKSLATDQQPLDIEDLKPACKGNCPGCPRTKQDCSLHVVSRPDGDSGPAVQWFRPTSRGELVKIVTQSAGAPVRFVAGDTGKGVYKNLPPSSVYVDLKKLPGMTDIELVGSGELTIGACVTLSVLIDFLEARLARVPYFDQLVRLLKRIANTPIRNSATWAGNFMMARLYDFVSDAFTAFAALSPTLALLHNDGKVSTVTIDQLLATDMADVVILSMTVPAHVPSAVYAVHKVMKRHENCHAYANASFYAVVNPDTGVITGQPRIFYGGLQTKLYRATSVEQYLVGKSVLDSAVLAGAIQTLVSAIPQTPMATSGTVPYRNHLAQNLLYKFFIQAAGSHASTDNLSALSPIRSSVVSSGAQSYDSDPSAYPLSESVQKLEIRAQATGEAVYISDLPILPGQLCGKFVLATEAPAKLASIDSSAAMAMPGVVKFISATSIPGCNSFSSSDEEIFAASDVHYVGQAIGMIIADSEYNADRAAKAVTADYTSTGKPILTIKDAIAAESFHSTAPDSLVVGNADAELTKAQHRVTGQVSCGSQYHFHMESQSALCVPLEDGVDVFSSTQSIAAVQKYVSQALAVAAGSVNVTVKRLGGGFGGKISRASQIASAAAVAAKICNTPVQVHMDIDSNLQMVGKRYPWMMDYEVGFDDDGLVRAVKGSVYCDAGYDSADDSVLPALQWMDNSYNIAAWNVVPKITRTTTASNTFCRAPGSVPAVFFMESMVEHVARTLGKSPDVIRTRNFYKKGETDKAGQPLTYWNVDQLWQDIEESAQIETRRLAITQFNQANRWKKRGMSRVPVKYGLDYFGAPFSAQVAVYGADGTIAISHAGIEMGQGMNTKAAQVAAATLGVPVASIHVKAATALSAANTMETGSSISSELVCQATLAACTELKERISSSTPSLPSTATWLDRVQYCAGQGIDLTARGWYRGVHKNSDPYAYNCYGVMCTEVELDVLTGETNVRRADLLYDCGRSVNPEIDVGQIEGAVVMGLGYWLTEEVIYEPETGANLTHNTWEYKPPMCLDVPQHMSISLLKNSPNPSFVLKSKAVAEPPQVMTCSALFAAKHCIEAALDDFQPGAPFFTLHGPGTPDALQPFCQPPAKSFMV